MTQTKYRVAELIVDVTAALPGDINDWPANVQDRIYDALERKSLSSRADFKIIQSYSGTDADTGPYIHVIAVAEQTIQ